MSILVFAARLPLRRLSKRLDKPCDVKVTFHVKQAFHKRAVPKMNMNRSRISLVITLAAVAFVAVAAIVDAARTDSLGPIWAVAWLPAVLVGVLYRPRSVRECWGRLGRRARS